MNLRRVLILEDDERLAKSLVRDFEDHNYVAIHITAISQIPEEGFDFAVLDLRLGGEYGLEAIRKIQLKSSNCKIVILTGYGSIVTAVEALKLGAIDYLTKPASFKEIESALLGQGRSQKVGQKIPSLAEVEHEYIDFVLAQNEGNISRTAKSLGLHRQSLQRKLKKYT